MGNDIKSNARHIARAIAERLDRKDGKDGYINAETWKNNGVKIWGRKDNINSQISIFQAEKSIELLLKEEAAKNSESVDNIGERWLKSMTDTQNSSGKYLKPLTENNDNTKINNSNSNITVNFENKTAKEYIASLNNVTKNKIISNMYVKWSKIFRDSPLNRDFYSKLYDIIEALNCSIRDCDFKPEKYKSKKEQTIDEVIAIFAGEAQLDPKARNGQYKGLFQLANPGLADSIAWAAKHQEIPEMKKIDKDININDFWNLPGEEQLNYLVAYIGKMREYSKIPASESVTPAQVWAMIKYPFEGNINSEITAQKKNAIQNVFKKSNVPHGSLS